MTIIRKLPMSAGFRYIRLSWERAILRMRTVGMKVRTNESLSGAHLYEKKEENLVGKL